MKLTVCVIGGGVVGLTTATLIQEQLRDAQVVLYAEKFLTETTSDGAAGIFRPSASFQGRNAEQTSKWVRDSFKYYENFLKNSQHANEIGVKEISGYLTTSRDTPVHVAHMDKLSPVYRKCTQDELNSFPGPPKSGIFLSTLLIECRRYLPYLHKKFAKNGGKMIRRRIGDFEELSSENFDIVINCTGLGSRQLCQDETIVPLRGQVFKVEAPWIKHFYYNDIGTYILPGFDAVTLGGVRQYEDDNPNVDPNDSKGIMDRCTRFLPSLKDAKIIREWVGHRPHRPQVRVEAELLRFSSKKSMIVVHNYGHGGYGVMTSPGTSMEAVQIAVDILKNNGQTYKAKL